MSKEKRHKHFKDEHEGDTERVIVNGVDVGWHKGITFLNNLKQFHEKCARQPPRKKVNVIQKILQRALEEKLGETNFRCVSIEYTGSSFEGAKVPKADNDPDFEFDMLFITEGGNQLKRAVDLDPDVPGFVFLEPRDYNIREHRFEKQLVKRSDQRKTLSAAKFLSDFHTALAQCIQEIGERKEMVAETDLHTDYLIKLRRHGPAIQMDIYLNTTHNAAEENEFLDERGQEVECDGVRQRATGDDNEQNNGIENTLGELEEEIGAESGISKENGRSMDEIKNRNGDADEEAIFETGKDADRKSDQGRLEENDKGNCQQVCFKFHLATKGNIGKKELSKLKKLYSVDVVPTLHVPSPNHDPEGEYYVAKPVKGYEDRIEELESAWRRSFSLEAKKKLKCADNENTCKKIVFRILKAIRNRECGLHKMNTYHLKNALLKELDGPDSTDWSVNSLAERFMDVLERLITEYAPGQQMSEYFIKELDLLEHMPEATRENIHCRLKRLRNSEKQMTRILEGRRPRKRRPRQNQANTELE